MKSNDYNEGNFINSDFGKNHIDLALKKIERLLTEESNLEYKKASLTNIFFQKLIKLIKTCLILLITII